MTPKDLDSRLQQLSEDIPDAIRKDLPKILANEAVGQFYQNFLDEGFFGTGWKEVKRRQGKTKGAAASRKILTDTGNLGNSLQEPKNASETFDYKAVVFSDVPYAEAHNEGTTRAGRNHNVTIPKRQFIGEHKDLDYALVEKATEFIGQRIDDILK